MLNSDERVFIEKSFRLAREALELKEVPVGCVFVTKNVVIGTGRNETNKQGNPTSHAEIITIREIEERGDAHLIPECTVFVTLEPCIMCASALQQLGVKRIVFGAENPRFGGIRSVGANGNKYEGIQIESLGGKFHDDAIELLKKFYDRENPFAPEEKRKCKN